MTPRMLFTGTLNDINAALNTLTYRSALHWNSVDGRNKDNITLVVKDRQAPSLHDRHVLYVYVRSVNDPPAVNVPGGVHVVDEVRGRRGRRRRRRKRRKKKAAVLDHDLFWCFLDCFFDHDCLLHSSSFSSFPLQDVPLRVRGVAIDDVDLSEHDVVEMTL